MDIGKELTECYRTLLAQAVKLTGSRDSARDLVHDTFVHALERKELFDPARGTVGAWLHRMMVNLFITEKRRLWSTARYVSLQDTMRVEVPRQESAVLCEEVLSFAGTLTKRRQIALLVGLDVLDKNATARRLGRKSQSLATALNKARAAIKRFVDS